MNINYQEAIKYYLNNPQATIKEVALLYQIDRGTLGKKLKLIGIKTNRNHKYSYNQDYFKDIGEEQAYWIGFLQADGNITDHQIRLRLKKDDQEILEKFNQCICGDIEIKIENGRGYSENSSKQLCNLTISCKEMVKDLEKYNIIPNKTTISSYYDFHNSTLQKAYIRGIFDGDGWCYFGKNSREIGICGTKELCLGIKDFLVQECQIQNISCSPINSIYRIRICNKDGIVKFFNNILNNKNLTLQRKYDLVKNYVAVLNEANK